MGLSDCKPVAHFLQNEKCIQGMAIYVRSPMPHTTQGGNDMVVEAPPVDTSEMKHVLAQARERLSNGKTVVSPPEVEPLLKGVSSGMLGQYLPVDDSPLLGMIDAAASLARCASIH